jgi:hypothetical protein
VSEETKAAELAQEELEQRDDFERVTLADMRNVEELLDRVEKLPMELGVVLLRTFIAIDEAKNLGGAIGSRLARGARERYAFHDRSESDD